MATATGRYSNLDRSFKIAARSLLTAFSREGVNKAFPSFTDAERERLYQMFIYVIKSLHGNIEEGFQQFCDEIEVATVLDKVDQFVEEQNLDVLSADNSLINRTSVEDIKERISKEKKEEIEYLKGLLEKTEERNSAMKARIEHLKEGVADFNDTRDALKKLERWKFCLSELQ
ncbi:uncharacterized protein LOC124682950 isoform X1 [Lolium rigidum]|uniref:uncharacterized protein LOC124682950 isoform X1 n=1 Tax=Lolium rigidum TaxID=89674 RepID=UPI001F5CB3DE|nr:uncharacterized protein LOC124682950 isoform X1 [Lolium rigidum]